MIAGSASVPIGTGFADPVAAAQSSFRLALEAMAQPGAIRVITVDVKPPPSVDPAAAALLLTLLDHETPLWLGLGEETARAERYFAFHCGCPIAARPELARFALCHATRDLAVFSVGTAEYPELSATILVQVPALEGGPAIRLRGPGIRDHAHITPQGIPPSFWHGVERNAALFPRGFDLVLVAGRQLCGLPRTTRVEA